MSTPTSYLPAAFHAAMLTLYQRAKAECHYNATRFLAMVSEHGGVETARRLIASDTPSEGYVRLWECGRLDLTVEALVQRPEFAPLFIAEELARARARLEEYGYAAP
jgi:hypothetical protein